MTTETKKRETKRRGNGEGSIYQRPDGRWTAQVTVGYNAAGKRVRKTVYGDSKGEVQEKLTRLQSSKLDGMLSDTGRLNLAAYLERWLADVARPTIRATTHVSYKGIIDNHISPRIGGIKLDKLTPAHVQGLYSALERDGASATTRRHCHVVLNRALKQAVKWGMIPRNVCSAVERPRDEEKEIQPLTAEQAQALLKAAAGDRLEAFYVVAVTTGMRLGELMGLQWGDVDLEAGAIQVRRTLQEVSGKFALVETKTKKSKRKVDLPKLAVDALHEHRKRQFAAGHLASGYVFTDTHGGHLRRSNVHRYSYKPLLKRAGLPEIRFHDLRHTAATLLLLDGVHPKVVQERLGHSKIGITLDTYSHVLPTMQKEAAARLDRLFAAKIG
jgi:integrase